jgi:hypothetical protein
LRISLWNSARHGRGSIDAPDTTDADRSDLATLDHLAHRCGMHPQLGCGFVDGEQHQIFVP